MSDFLEQKRREIAERMRELEPLIEEYRKLEAASNALADVAARPGSRPAPGPSPAVGPSGARARAPRAPTATGSPEKAPGRPRGSGTRARQALELVVSRPGITIPEMASALEIKQNYLYRVLPMLESEGKVVKRERGWHATPETA